MRITVAPGRRLFVDVEGCGLAVDGPRMREKPTLLLVHGGPGFDHSGFKPLFSPLADLVQIVYFDQRGHGRSDACPLAEVTLDVLADDIARLCDALGVENPIVLGHSFGGFVVQRYLARHPGHPRAAVLSSTSHDDGLERQLARFERLGGPEAREAAHALWTQPDPSSWERYRRSCMPLYVNPAMRDSEAAARASFDQDILFHWISGERRGMQLLPGLSCVRCPVMVMAGERDPVCPMEDAREIAEAIPAPWGRHVLLSGAGHSTWRDRPAAAMAALRAFIADVMEAADDEEGAADAG